MTAEEQLAYERQQAEVLAIRQRRDAGPKRDEPSRLATVLNSTVLVALVGVLGTGIFGAWISGLIQQRAKDNELERVSHEQRVSSQNTAVLRVLTLVANQASAIDDLLTIVHSSYNESAFSGQELADLVAWKKTIRSNHDQADSTWRREKITAGYTLLYVFDNDPAVTAAWTSLAAAGDGFEACTNAWYGQFAEVGSDMRPEQVCTAEREALAASLTNFTGAVSARRAASAVE